MSGAGEGHVATAKVAKSTELTVFLCGLCVKCGLSSKSLCSCFLLGILAFRCIFSRNVGGFKRLGKRFSTEEEYVVVALTSGVL